MQNQKVRSVCHSQMCFCGLKNVSTFVVWKFQDSTEFHWSCLNYAERQPLVNEKTACRAIKH